MKPDVQIFPARDASFRAEVERAVTSLEEVGGAVVDPQALVEELRPHYPNVTVTRRDEFGTVGEARAVWYVFRDKRVRPEDWRRERLYDALARARMVIGDSRVAMKRSRKASSASTSRWSRD